MNFSSVWRYYLCPGLKMLRLRLTSYSVHLRISRPEMFCKIGVLRNFAKFTGKHLSQSLFFNKVAKEPLIQVFSCEFEKFLRTTFFIEHLWWHLYQMGTEFWNSILLRNISNHLSSWRSKISGLELRKKICLVKNLDNNILCCARSASTIAMWS